MLIIAAMNGTLGAPQTMQKENIKNYYSKVEEGHENGNDSNEATNLFYSYVGCYGKYAESRDLHS